MLDPARAAGSAARTRCRRGRAGRPSLVEDDAGASRWSPGRSPGSSGRDAIWPERARPAGCRAAGRRGAGSPPGVRPVARCSSGSSISSDPVAGADRVDRHAGLHPPAVGERQQARAASRRASPAARRAAPPARSAAEPLDRPARVAERDAEAAALAARRSAADGQVALARLDRLDERDQLAGALAEVRVAEQDGRPRRRTRRARPRAAAVTLPPLPCGRRAAHHPGAVPHRDLGGPVARGVVGDQQPGARAAPPPGRRGSPPIRSASFRAATITTRPAGFPRVTAGYCPRARGGRRGPHHRHRLEDRGRGRRPGRRGRHRRHPRVDEDGDAGRGRGPRQGRRDPRARRASRSPRATSSSSSNSLSPMTRGARRREAAPRPARRGGRPPDAQPPGLAQRARPRDARRARRGDADASTAASRSAA